MWCFYKSRFKIKIQILFVGLFFYQFNFAQQLTHKDSVYAQVTKYDTNYIYKYNSKLIVGIYQAYRNYNIIISPVGLLDTGGVSEASWKAESNHVTGIDLNYDKFGLSIGIRSKPPENRSRTGETQHFNLGFTFGGNRWLLETAVMSFKGFYDENTKNYDSSFNSSSNYYQNPNLSNNFFKLKFWYFTNHHKFAFKSGNGGMYRQLKTRSTWILGANTRFSSLYADSTIVPAPIKKYYNHNITITELSSAALSVFAGAAVNFVILKGFFINFAFVVGPEFQSLDIVTNTGQATKTYLSTSGESRFSIGFNVKKWYASLSNYNDFTLYTNEQFKLKTKLLTGNLNIGYRFAVKEPKAYDKFQKTRLYNLF